MTYLHQGGNLIATGQDFASTFDILGGNAPTALYGGYLGALYKQDSIFDPAGLFLPPAPSIIGAPQSAFTGMVLDLSGLGDGGVNQGWVDEVTVIDDLDVGERENIHPIFTAISPYVLAQGTVALARSSEPTLENPGANFAFRTVYLAFGLEGVNNDTGFNTREDLLGGILDWVNDTPQVTIEAATVGHPMDLVTLTATIPSGINAGIPVSYRWDFGDGSPYATGGAPNAGHIYGAPGTYQARVEMTDAYGHKVVSAPVEVIVPAVYVNPTTDTFTTTHDTYINSWAAETANGSKSTLWTGHIDSLRGLLQFDTSGLLPDQPVITATLHIYRTERRGSTAAGVVAAHMVTKAWSEDSVTWNTPWDVPGAAPDNIISVPDGTVEVTGAAAGWYEIDITDMVKVWVANSATNNGIMLIETSADDAFDGWASSAWWVEDQRPFITVDTLAP